jgi:thiol:disulfide interchange protein DsbD
MRKLLLLLLSAISLFALQAKFLMPDEAFKPSAAYSDGTVEAVIELGEDIYLYEEKVTLEMQEGNGVVIAGVTKDEAIDHQGDMAYVEAPHLKVELAREAGVSGMRNVTLLLSYQGCSERGICYEPMNKSYTFEVNTDALPEAAAGADETAAAKPVVVETVIAAEPPAAAEKAAAPVSETDRIARTIKEGNIFLILATFFGFGLLLSMTPCVFPMIPILSSVIVSQGGGEMTTKRAFFLSLVYVLAMSVAYTVAGVLAGLFGSNLQAAMQAPEVIIAFALIFVLLSFSMFGMFELQIPNFLQAKLTSAGKDHKGIAGVAIMGFLSALIVGPCVAAPLAGALIYIGQTGDALIGGMALFALSMGMGLPLLAVGTTAGRFMPKPGEWMDNVKAFFGVLLLGVSIWMISRIVPEPVTLLLWSVLLVFVSVSLGAFEPIREACSRCGHAYKKALGILVFMYAVTLFIGAITGAGDMLHPLEKITAPERMVAQASAEKRTEFIPVHSIAELDKQLAKAKGKKVLLDFSAKWCTSCKELEEITFADAAVQAEMAKFVLIRADVTLNSEEEKALTKKFGLFGPPGIIFFDSSGKQMKGREIVGYIAPEAFIDHMNMLQDVE